MNEYQRPLSGTFETPQELWLDIVRFCERVRIIKNLIISIFSISGSLRWGTTFSIMAKNMQRLYLFCFVSTLS